MSGSSPSSRSGRSGEEPGGIPGFTADAVRAAEAPLLAAGEPLMLRAAAALAAHVRRELADRGRPGPSDGLSVDGLSADGLSATGSAAGDRPTGAGPHVLVLAGAGANGGDGLHAAAMLRADGIAADALAVSTRLHEEGAQTLRAAGGTIRRLGDLAAADDPVALSRLLASAELVLDAILGLGGRPEVPAELTPLLAAVRASGVPVIAVDLPSFVDASTGRAAPEALAARSTVTFGAVKAGTLLPGGSGLVGVQHLVDIGLSAELLGEPAVRRLDDAAAARLWPRPRRDDSKYTRGVVALLAGSARYPGAAVLAASGAARAGAGMVRLLAPQPVLDLALRARPELVGHPVAVEHEGAPGSVVGLDDLGRTDALVVGPGLDPEDPRVRAGIAALARGDDGRAAGIRRGAIDAGALGGLRPGDRFTADVVLTPHRGEAARLADRLGLAVDARASTPAAPLARALAAATGATVLLKGAVTVIAPGSADAEPAGRALPVDRALPVGLAEASAPLLAQDDAVPQLATAGTGDVLAGILGTLLAAGLPGPEAAALAALVHGRAGALASRGGIVPIVALDVADHLPDAVGTILACVP